MKKNKTGIELEGKRGICYFREGGQESLSGDGLERGFGFQTEEVAGVRTLRKDLRS